MFNSKYDISDKDVVSKIVDEALQTLDEIAQESGTELGDIKKEVCDLEAQKAFATIQMAFTLESFEDEYTFAGAVYKGKKLKQGPISIAERKNFKVLTERLEKVNAEMAAIDEEEASDSDSDMTPGRSSKHRGGVL